MGKRPRTKSVLTEREKEEKLRQYRANSQRRREKSKGKEPPTKPLLTEREKEEKLRQYRAKSQKRLEDAIRADDNTVRLYWLRPSRLSLLLCIVGIIMFGCYIWISEIFDQSDSHPSQEITTQSIGIPAPVVATSPEEQAKQKDQDDYDRKKIQEQRDVDRFLDGITGGRRYTDEELHEAARLIQEFDRANGN